MIFKDYDNRTIKLLDKQANKIIKLNKSLEKLSDEELSNKTLEFKERISKGESLDNLLEDAFAVCREATHRVLGKKQYKVQLMGGIALHQGRVVEMKTGEGKTLTELCPAYLNALSGEGVHVITVNDYLAKRDKEEMEPLFKFLNLSTGLVIDGVENKKEEYSKDITYSTNTELGFDYLRDNLVYRSEDKMQRKLNYVIIDEVDSVLIDDARTPLIMAGAGEEPSKLYYVVSNIISNLKEEDYEKQEKDNFIFLSDSGIKKVEKILGIDNLAEIKYSLLNHIISQSLRAYYLMEKDKDYIVSDGEIILVDTNTGRIADGRRFSDGLHQCLEAKERLKVNAENKTIASITYQNFFRLYNKISGMSGTVKTEELEFREIYNLDVVVIPTNKPIKRIDKQDKIFLDNKSKLDAVIEDIIETHKTQRPILVGTPSIDKSEELSALLIKKGIQHRLLNAKTKKDEADIISLAGNKGSITIATNIAGRGTDIKITDEVNELGGLKVIGTERTESKRIDNQLIGRSGRQGNNGESQFYLSCDDKLLNVYGEGKLKAKLEKMGFKNGQEIDSKIISKQVDKAQKVINAINFEARKDTIKYDEVVNSHREIIYRERDIVITEEDITIYISNLILDSTFNLVSDIFKEATNSNQNITKKNILDLSLEYIDEEEKEKFFEILIKKVPAIYYYNFPSTVWNELRRIDYLSKIVDFITHKLIEYVNDSMHKLNFLTYETMRGLLIEAVDTSWINHLNEMEVLKKVVKDQSYNQKKPIDVYTLEAGTKCDELIKSITDTFIDKMFYIINLNLEL